MCHILFLFICFIGDGVRGKSDSKATRGNNDNRDSGDKVWANSSPTGLRGGAGVEKGSDRSSATSRPSAGRGGVGGRGKHS